MRDAAVKRQMIEIVRDCIQEAGAGGTEIGDLETWFAHRVYSLVLSRWFTQSFERLDTALDSALDHLKEVQKQNRRISGLETGFAELDCILSGLHAGDLTVLAGLSGTGKTGMVLSIARHISLKVGGRVALFSPKASTPQVTQRLLCIEAQIDIRSLTAGALQAEDWQSLAAASSRLARAPIYIWDDPGLTYLRLRALSYGIKRQIGVNLVIIDTLHLVDTRGTDDIGMSRNLKALAVGVDVPVLALLQLRGGGQEGNREPPQLGDLEKAGYPDLEKVADTVIFIHPLKEGASGLEESHTAEIIVAKNRHGMTGATRLTWNPRSATYEEHGRTKV